MIDNDEIEFFEFTAEEQANWINLLFNEAQREKVLTYAPDAPKRISTVVRQIKYLMDSDGCECSIEFERCEMFQMSLYIHVDVVDFGTSPKNFWIFQDVIRKVDTIEVKYLPYTGQFRTES